MNIQMNLKKEQTLAIPSFMFVSPALFVNGGGLFSSFSHRVKKSGGAPTETNGGGSRVARSNKRKMGANTAIRFFTPARIIPDFVDRGKVFGGLGVSVFLKKYASSAPIASQGVGALRPRRVTRVTGINLPSFLSPKTPVVVRTSTGEMSLALGRCVAAPTICKYPAPFNRCKRFPARGNEQITPQLKNTGFRAVGGRLDKTTSTVFILVVA